MKKIDFETIKKIDYVLVLLIAIVCIITFLVEKISRYMPKHYSEPAHISVVNSNDDISSEETKESLDFLEKLEDVYIYLTADHSTPISVMNHSGDPVPVLIRGPEVRVDDVKEFSEVACAKGGLNRIRGADVMNIMMDLMNYAHKFGA